MEVGKASILATVESLVATIVGVTLFNEILTAIKVIGMTMIFVTIVLLNKK